jgi:hypothetical protein
LFSQIELLEVEISYLTRPQRLGILAEKTMRMAAPDAVQYRLSWVDISSGE